MCNAQNEILEEDKVRPGFYHQWREMVPSTHPDNPYYKPDCHAKCIEKCGANHKGVSVCGSMFEYADDPLKVEVMSIIRCSERPNGKKRGSAEPERFGNFHQRFGRTVRPNLSQIWSNF